MEIEKIAGLIYNLRRKCALKDLYFVQRAGITPAEYNCLLQFFDRRTLGMKEIGASLGITPAGVTRIVSELEKRGILERRIDPRDRRSINVLLTRKGGKIVDEIHQASLDLHAEIVSRIPGGERGKMIEAIEELTAAIDGWLASCGKPGLQD